MPAPPRVRVTPPGDEMHAYDAKDLERLFGLPPSTVRTLARAGTIHPVKRSGRLHYSFHDLVVLRTAGALRAARVSPRRIHKTLQQLRALLPSGSRLNTMSLTALGDRIAIREGGALREADSGQYALALDIVEDRGTLRIITRPERSAAQRVSNAAQAQPQLVQRGINAAEPRLGTAEPQLGIAQSGLDAAQPQLGLAKPQPAAAHAQQGADCELSALEYYIRGLETEEDDEPAARRAYEACLRADPGHAEARLNLGRLLHLAGELAQAEALYRGAFRPDPFIAFNLGVVLEDLEREPEAIMAYRAALAMDPDCGDAHYNLARLYARARNPQASLRHLLAYRRLLHHGTSP